MNGNDLEFLISQYVDGTLDAEQSAALEVRLRSDAQARALLAEHRRLNTLLTENTTLPAIRFDRLAETISANIDQHSEMQIHTASRAVFGRWIGAAGAVAACLLVGLMVFRSDKGESSTESVPSVTLTARVVDVSGPSAEVTTLPRIAQVSIDMPVNTALLSTLAWQDLSPAGARIVVSAGEPPTAPDALSGQ